MLIRCLIVVDDPALRRRLLKLREEPDLLVNDAKGHQKLLQGRTQQSCDLILIEEALLPEPAHPAIAKMRRLPDEPDIIVLADQNDAARQASLLAAGCMATVEADLPEGFLEDALLALFRKRREAAIGRQQAEGFDSHVSLGDFVSLSPQMQRFMEIVKRVVPSDSSILLLGETGVGKERLARAIHDAGPRGRGPFVVVNCGAIPETLLESELFGHDEGAFTGAVRSRRGHFELAHRGTIFLDEIGEMPLHLQVKLLRVLQERRIQRLGSERSVPVDVRVMAATNRNLADEMEAKRFRPDLYYRLSVVCLTLPPLRDRREDIPQLIDHYIEYFQTQMPTRARRISRQAIDALERYAWPGNIRELMNVLERAVLLCSDEEITLDDLPDGVSGSRAVAADEELVEKFTETLGEAEEHWLERPLGEAKREWLAAFERAYLLGLLTATRGRVGEAAMRAGISPRSLYTKMKRHGLRKEEFRGRESG